MPKARVIQHVGCETLGTIAESLDAAGVSFQYVRPFEGEPVPTIDGADGLIVMGGPMGVYERPRYPFLKEEMRLIEQFLKAERPVLGVCLGSQLLAAVLGAPVAPGKKKEIGWHPVQLTPEAQADRLWGGVAPTFIAYHWHGDLFHLPKGAVSLARSAQTEHQAFRYGLNAYGFLFHMEVTEKIVGEMVKAFSEELHAARIDGEEIVRQLPAHLPSLRKIGEAVFQRWAEFIR